MTTDISPSFVPALSTTSDKPAPPAVAAPAAAMPTRPDKTEPAATPEQQNTGLVAAWHARRKEAAGRYEDYEEVAESAKTPMSVPMTHAIVNSKFGPDVDGLVRTAIEAARIAAMRTQYTALAIGRVKTHARVWQPGQHQRRRRAPCPPIAAAGNRRQPIPDRAVSQRAAHGRRGARLGEGRLICGTRGKPQCALH